MQGMEVVGARFELLEMAGRGGMGTVYRAVDRSTNKVVALKELAELDRESIGRFTNEARVLEEIEHPNVVQYVTHGVGTTGKRFLVMEWLDGMNLAERLASSRLSIEETVEIGKRVGAALGFTHSRGIVHRDIKPSNIFLPAGDVHQVKVLDFGIARQDLTGTILTQTGTLIGTPGYMAPEQARGDRKNHDARADIFSLGCVLFECLTGRPAFQAVHVLALLAKLLLDEPRRVRELRPDVPAGFDSLIHRMLSKDPANRPPHGDAVVAELDAVNWEELDSALPMAHAPESLTHAEKRLVSIIAVIPLTFAHVGETTIEGQHEVSSVEAISDKRLNELRRVAQTFGARLEEIANGMLIALLVGSGPATDQAAVAARCALRMQWTLPEYPHVLLTRRSESSGNTHVGEFFDQAASLLQNVHESEFEGMLLIDDVTHALLDVRFEIRQGNGRIWLRGERDIGEEVRTLLGKPSLFVGRERELRHLLELVDEAIVEQWPSAVLVSADAGIGKSRLRYECMQRLRSNHPQAVIVLGRGDSVSAGSAFSLVSSAYRNALGMTVDEPMESQRAKLHALVSRLLSGDDLRRVSGFIGEMMGIPLADETDPRVRAARQNPAIMADQIQTAYVDMVRAAVEKYPVLLVLEDLHWGDRPSIKLIDAALRELSERPFMVLAFARPEVHDVFPRLWAGRSLHTIVLNGLTKRSSESLVKNALGTSVEPETIAKIVDRAGGNAFYLEELVRAVSEGRRDTLPETILGMVEARIAALDSRARRILRAASVFGESFWLRGLHEVLRDERNADESIHLDRLCRLELITPRPSSRFAGEKEYGFRHALVREAAYAMLVDNDRALGHDRAGDWLAQSGEQDSMILAGHFERSPDPSKAALHYAKAAEQAMCGADFPTAIVRAERGIACGARGPAHASLRYVLSSSYMLTTQYANSYKNARLLLADPLAGDIGRARAIGYSISNAIILGKLDVFGDLVSEVLGLSPGPDEAAVVAHALYMPFIMLVVAGKRDHALACLQRLNELAAKYPDDLLTISRAEVARLSWARENDNDVWQALQHNLIAVRLFDQVGARENVSVYKAHLGLSHLCLGDFAAAESVLDELLDTEESATLAHMYGVHYKSLLLIEMGRFDAAFELVSTLAKDAFSANDFILLWCARLSMATVFMARGELDQADQVLEELGESNAFLPFLRARFLSLRSEIRRLQRRFEDAVRLAKSSVDAGAVGPRYNYGEDPLAFRLALALHASGNEEAARQTMREVRADLLTCAEKIPIESARRGYLEGISWHANALGLAREWLTN